MSYLISVGTIATRARQRANLEGATAFLPDAELYDLINISYAEWYDLVRLTTWGGQYYRSAYSFSTVATTSAYALPADFLNLISVDIAITPNAQQVLTAKPYQEEERNMYRAYPFGWISDRPVYYQLQGPNINFIPIPQAAFQITLNYCPAAKQLAGDSDSIDSINGWEEWIVLDVAIKMLTKDGQLDIMPALTQQREAQRARIQSAAYRRDRGQAERVHDRTGDFDYWGEG